MAVIPIICNHKLKILVQSANYAVERYFTESLGIEDGDTGGIYYIHSQGSLFNVHPHAHALVPAGIMKAVIFYGQYSSSHRGKERQKLPAEQIPDGHV